MTKPTTTIIESYDDYKKILQRAMIVKENQIKFEDEARKVRHALLMAREKLRMEEQQLLEDLVKLY